MELLTAIDILLSQPVRKMDAKLITCHWLIDQVAPIGTKKDYNLYALQRATIIQGERTKHAKPTTVQHDSH